WVCAECFDDRANRSTLEDRDSGLVADLYADVWNQECVELRAVLPAGCLQLLSERKSAERPGANSAGDRNSGPVADKCWCACGHLVCERAQQREDRRDVSADVFARERHAGDCGPNVERSGESEL